MTKEILLSISETYSFDIDDVKQCVQEIKESYQKSFMDAEVKKNIVQVLYENNIVYLSHNDKLEFVIPKEEKINLRDQFKEFIDQLKVEGIGTKDYHIQKKYTVISNNEAARKALGSLLKKGYDFNLLVSAALEYYKNIDYPKTILRFFTEEIDNWYNQTSSIRKNKSL